MGKKGFFATLIVILLLIFLLFPSSTGEEHILIPEKIIDLENPGTLVSEKSEDAVSFAFGDYFGYFNENLSLSYLKEIEYKVAVSDRVFINYSKIPQSLEVQNNRGDARAKIETTGYPIIDNDRIIVISDSFVSFYDLDGHLYWKKEILSIITSLSISENRVLIAYLDGFCELINESGQTLFKYRPGGSRIEAIYSVAMSSDNQYIAVIAGLDPQRFILLQNRKGEFKPVFHFELNHEFRRSISMYFSEDNRQLFFENTAGINIFNIDSKILTKVGDEGRMEKIYKDIDEDYYSAMLLDSQGGYLKIFTPEYRTLLEKRFIGNNVFLKKNKNHFYVGTDNLIMSLKMESR